MQTATSAQAIEAPPPGAIALTEGQVAFILQCSISTVRQMDRTGQLPRVKWSRNMVRYARAVVERLVEKGFREPVRVG